MLGPMARRAEGDPVCHIKAQREILRPRFDVVRVQIAASAVAAFLTGVVVAAKHCVPPFSIGERRSAELTCRAAPAGRTARTTLHSIDTRVLDVF